jgi:hypothetical protein
MQHRPAVDERLASGASWRLDEAIAFVPKSVRNAAAVLELTWSYASPDGRATFELRTVDDQLRLRSAIAPGLRGHNRPDSHGVTGGAGRRPQRGVASAKALTVRR